MDNNKITFKEFVCGMPRLVSLFAWTFLLYCVLAAGSVLGTIILALFCICVVFYFAPDIASEGVLFFSEWVHTHSSFLDTIAITVFLLGLVAFVRKVTIAQAKSLQKG